MWLEDDPVRSCVGKGGGRKCLRVEGFFFVHASDGGRMKSARLMDTQEVPLAVRGEGRGGGLYADREGE